MKKLKLVCGRALFNLVNVHQRILPSQFMLLTYFEISIGFQNTNKHTYTLEKYAIRVNVTLH